MLSFLFDTETMLQNLFKPGTSNIKSFGIKLKEVLYVSQRFKMLFVCFFTYMGVKS